MSNSTVVQPLQSLTSQLAEGYRSGSAMPEQAGKTLCTIVPELPQLTERTPDIVDLAVANVNRQAVKQIKLRTTNESGRVKLDFKLEGGFTNKIIFRFDSCDELVKTVTDFFNGAINCFGKQIKDVYYRVLEFKDSLSNEVIKWSLLGRAGDAILTVDSSGQVQTNKLYAPVRRLLPYSQAYLRLRRMSEILPDDKRPDFIQVTGAQPLPARVAASKPATKLVTLSLRDFDSLLKDSRLIQQGLLEKKYTDAELPDRHPYMIVNNQNRYLRIEFNGASSTSVFEILRSLAEGKAKLDHIKVDSFDTLEEAQTARALEQSKLVSIQDQASATKTNLAQFVISNYAALKEVNNLALPYADQGY